ncbi:hypothetical protein CF319_g1230 [Tilletia indica]|nr:hypothetical protein CF319_g1230 [Tilletia indica]
MTAKGGLSSDDLRSVVQNINAERIKDSEWEAAFDRHLNKNRSKRVAPLSKRLGLNYFETGSEEAALASASQVDPPPAPLPLPVSKPIPTGPSLLQRLGNLSSVLPTRSGSLVERAGLTANPALGNEGSSRDLDPAPIPTSKHHHPSLPLSPSAPAKLRSKSPANLNGRVRRTKWDMPDPAAATATAAAMAAIAAIEPPRDATRARRDSWVAPTRRAHRPDAEEGDDGDHHRKASGEHHRHHNHHRNSSRPHEDGASSRPVYKPRDTWEASSRDHHDRSRCDTHVPPSLLASDPSFRSRTPRHSLEDDRESVSSSHYYSHKKSSTYGGPLPSPPQHTASLGPPPPSLPPPQPPPPSEPRGFAPIHIPQPSEQSANGWGLLPPPPAEEEKQEELFPLPHELPFDADDRNYIAWPPPSVAATLVGTSNAEGKGKEREAVVRFAPRPGTAAAAAAEAVQVKDPRLKLMAEGKYGLRGRRKVVTTLNVFNWERDSNSVGPLPPTAVAVAWQDNTCHFSEILKFFQPFGRIEATEAELDKDIGTRMPFLWVKFAHDFDTKGHVKAEINPGRTPQDAIKIVPKVIKELDGFRLPGKADVRLSVRADAERVRYRAAYEAELQRRRAERAGVSAPDPAKAAHAQTPLPSVGAMSSPSLVRADGANHSPVSTRDEHAHTANGWYGAEGSARRTNSFSRPKVEHGHGPPTAAAQLMQNGPVQQPPTRPARWRLNGNASLEPNSREYAGIPKGPKASRASKAPRWDEPFEGEADGWKTAHRIGRNGPGPGPGPGPAAVSGSNNTNLPTEEIMRRLANLGRSYFRWPKGTRKIRFSELKGLFHGNANIDLLEQDEGFFYCCLKSEQLTMQHHRTPVRCLRGPEYITLQLCPPLDARLYGAPQEVRGHENNEVGSQMAFHQLTDALVNSAKQHANQQQMEGLLRHPHQTAPAVDAMAVLANSTSMPAAPTRGVPLPSIRRREHIPEAEQDEEDVLPPSKFRKVSGRAREYQEYRGSSLEPHGRGGVVKGSSPSHPLAQATPTESTRMGDSDDDDDVGGIKDDDTQTTEEMVEERSGEDEKKRNGGAGMNGSAPRGVKRALRQIFSSDEEDGNAGGAADEDGASDSADDEDDDVSSVSKALMSFKASPPRKKKHVAAEVEEDDALASMLLDTVTSIDPVQVHDVALDDILSTIDSTALPPTNGSTRKPPKAAAKANKKAKIAAAAAAAAAAAVATVPAKNKKGKSSAKQRPEAIKTLAVPEPEVAIVVTQPEDTSTPTESIPPTPTEANAAGSKSLSRKSDPRTKKGRRERARSPSPDPFALNLAQNEEDLYFLRLACERIRDGLGVGEEDVPDVGEDGNMPAHASGAARTEGYYKIPASQKAAHLPDRNKAIVEETTTAARTVGTARGNRAESRRVLMNIELHKKESATDTDILKFNQLSARKKQLRFAKSPIHDWGLYAMEQIPAGDMVIEYVGEVIRQQVADEREKRYERQGQFSTYLFRVDDELVVDATMKGNIARLMNHCCAPNCTAKILTVNGEKRIALFAKSTILPGQELTYDYKFQSTGDDADQISCLCGSPHCRKFL